MPGFSGNGVRAVSSIAIMESHWRELQVKWWVRRLARRSISPTFQDVNININDNSLYYLMSRGNGCNWLNSITNIRLGRGGMLSINGRSYVLRHVTQRIVELWKGAQLIKLCWLSSTGEVTWEDHVLKDKWEEGRKATGWMIDNFLSQT